MAAKLKLIPGSTIRWGARRFVVVDYVGLDAVIAREVGKRIRFAGGKLRKANLDLWVTRNTGVVTNAAYPFDSPKKVVVGEVLNRIDGLSHSQIINDPRFSFANSALLFAFNSRLPAQIRKYFRIDNRLTLENRHLARWSVYFFNATKPKSGAVQIITQRPNENQSAGQIEFFFHPP